MEDLILSFQAREEALKLAEEILKNIELSETKLDAVALKSSRLARILGEIEFQKIFQFEAGGYPGTSTGISHDIFELCRKAGRVYQQKAKNGDEKEIKEVAYRSPISAIEGEIAVLNASIVVDTNHFTRGVTRNNISVQNERLASRRAFIHQYASSKYYQLKLSEIASDIFIRARSRLDGLLQEFVPHSVQKTAAIYANLISANPEDWSNAVHSCRRLLQDLADALYPARADETRIVNGKEKIIRLGNDAYINRLISYIEDNSDSKRFDEIVGSHLKFIGERIDAVFKAAQKGSHDSINTREEADRYVIYTYLIAGDILSLNNKSDE